MMVEAPDHKADSATPTKMMLSGVASPMRENNSTTTLDTMAPANAHRAIAVMPISDDDPKTVGTIIRMATVAPNAAPWEIPTVEAEARGFPARFAVLRRQAPGRHPIRWRALYEVA